LLIISRRAFHFPLSLPHQNISGAVAQISTILPL